MLLPKTRELIGAEILWNTSSYEKQTVFIHKDHRNDSLATDKPWAGWFLYNLLAINFWIPRCNFVSIVL